MTSQNALAQLLQNVSLPKQTLFIATLSSTLNKIFDIIPEILIGISIDVIVHQQHSLVAKLGIIDPVSQLYLLGAITAVLWILESIFEYCYSIAWHSLAQAVQQAIRLKLYAHIQHADLAYLETKTAGGLINVILDDINQLEQFLSQGPNEIIQLTVNIIFMGCIFLYLSPLLTALTLLPIPFVIGIAYYFQHRLAALYEGVRHASDNLATHVAYRLQGITTIKSYATESYELDALHRESNAYRSINREATKISATYIPIVRMAVMVGFIMSLVVGGIYALRGIIPINWYAALVFLTQRFLWPFTTITTITTMYEKARASAKRILTILRTIPTVTEGAERFQCNPQGTGIQFNNVSFSYPNGVRIFDKITLDIPPQKTIALVGTTGSGKSTIIKLLLRLYDSSSGSILIDNQDIKLLTFHDLRKAMALVSQDIYLIDGTIAANIAYGSEKQNRADIVRAAQIAQAHDFIIQLPNGYDTKVQENGKNLSGGQRQRLSIARAILKRSPILIFDEATSAIDNETEAAMQRSMEHLKRDHTIIIIAHRLSTVRTADRILVLQKGVVIESGSHDELLLQKGAYAQLWNAQ